MLEATEDKVALVLLVLGSALLWWVGLSGAGVAGAVVVLVAYGLYAVISVIAGIAAAYATASLINASFGLLHSAVLRLAGIIVFTAAISVAIPYGGLLSLLVYIGLLFWLFELEPFEILVFTIILWVVGFLVGLALVAMLVSAAGAAA